MWSLFLTRKGRLRDHSEMRRRQMWLSVSGDIWCYFGYSPSNHRQRKNRTSIWGVLACENNLFGGVNLKVCSPDVTFKIQAAWHSCALQVAIGLSWGHTHSCSGAVLFETPPGPTAVKRSVLHKIKQNANSSSQSHGLPWGKEKEF